VEESSLIPAALESPFVFNKDHEALHQIWRMKETLKREEVARAVDSASDYLYVGEDLRITGGQALPKDIIVASSNTTIMRTHLAVAFVDGHVRFITTDEIEKLMAECNAGRKEIGLGPLRPPPIIERAIEEATAATRRK
jgi:hypothetical protein